MVSFGEVELRIAVRTEVTLFAGGKLLNCDAAAPADGVCCSCEEVRLAGGPSDMVGNIDGGNIVDLM